MDQKKAMRLQIQGKYFHETGEGEYTIKGNENPQSGFTPICNCSEPGKIGGCAIPTKCEAFLEVGSGQLHQSDPIPSSCFV